MKGRIIRLPSEKESQRAEEKGYKPEFPTIGRFFTKGEKTYITLNHMPDVVLMMSEDKPKEDKPKPKEEEDIFE